MRRILAIAVAGIAPLANGGTYELDAATDAAIRGAIEAPAIVWAGNFLAKPQFDVSADARQVVYAVEQGDIASNTITVSLWLAQSRGDRPPRKLLDVRRAATIAPVNPSFSPDATQVAITGFGDDTTAAIVDVRSGAARKLVLSELGNITDVEWSPTGNEIAVHAVPKAAPPPPLGVSVSTVWSGQSLTDQADRLAVLDADTQQVIAVTPPDLDVTGMAGAFDWSPDGSQLAFSARRVGARIYDAKFTDAYLFDKKSGVRDLVNREGLDLDPRWSPTGRAITFLTDEGTLRWRGGASLGYLDLDKNLLRTLPAPSGPQTSVYSHAWSGSNVLFVGMRTMGCPLFSVSIAADRTTQLTPDDLGCYGAARTGASGQVFTVRHSFEHPGELVASTPRPWQPVSVSRLEVSRDLPRARTQAIYWDSADGKFQIPGVLLVPETNTIRKRPLFVSIAGGPSMITPYVYNAQAQYPVYAALLRDYAVLLPNTRGRGGFGRKFAAAIADERSFLGGAFSDVMTGVDHAVRSFNVDPDRLLLAGFSYGGTLAFYASAHTDRFKTIFASEGIVDVLGRIAQNDSFMPSVRQRVLFGVSSIYDPDEQRIMSEQSALKYVANVKTPLLIECGVSALGSADCLRYFRAVKETTNTPTELIVYPRTGHGIFEPALRYDSARRHVEWMDRWVTGTAATKDR